METITLTNSYHGTSVTLRTTNNQLTPAQVKRARRELCGIRTCTCGGYCGERGMRNIVINPLYDGGAEILPVPDYADLYHELG